MTESTAEDLQLDQDRAFQERFWTFQRVAWVLFAIIVLAAVAGLSGQGGPFARAKAAGPTGIVDYPRVTRWESSEDLRVTIAPGGGDQAVIDFSSSFSTVFELEDVRPTPADSYSTAAGQRLVFDLRAPDGPREIVIYVRAMQPSLTRSFEMRIGEGPVLRLTPVVLP